MGLEMMIERLTKAGMKVEVKGDDRNSKLYVDDVEVGSVCDDIVTLYCCRGRTAPCGLFFFC